MNDGNDIEDIYSFLQKPSELEKPSQRIEVSYRQNF